LSRPVSGIPQVFGNRSVGVIGATAGGFGTILAQDAWMPVLRTLRMCPWFGARVMVSHAAKVFNEVGELVDETVRGQLGDYLRGFVRFIQAGAASQ
jgi:NAD(P)H-dependent FMN reductase